jgi:hypothetical protein
MDDPNKLNHIFNNPDHNLDRVVRQYGSQEAAAWAMIEAIDSALQNGSLMTDPEGRYRQLFDIGGNAVWISGKVVDGVPRVGSAWVRA